MGEWIHSRGWAIRARRSIRLLLGWLVFSTVPAMGFAARPWPDTSLRIVPFSDQLPDSLTAAQREFAATRFAGTQKMTRSAIRSLRAYNPDFLCLHYQLAVGAGPEAFIIGDLWASDWTFVNAQSPWFLRTSADQRVHQTQWNWDVMDVRYADGHAVSGFPAYWISNCLARIRAAENDGVFADSFTPDSYGFGQTTPPHPWLEDIGLCLANWVPSLEQFGAEAKQALSGTNGFVFLPNLGGLVTSWLDMDYGIGHGGMIEGFAFWGPDSYFDPADWELQMDRALRLVRSNKIVICQSYPAPGDARERMFATASYLLVKGSRTYLNLLSSDDVALEYYPEYAIDLGGAVGAIPSGVDALRHADWGVFRRDYSNGIVLVNPSAAAINIASLGTNYWRVIANGGGAVNASGGYGGSLATSLVSSLSLPARSGAVLLRRVRTLTVASSGGAYATIQAALDAAQPGDTVDVRAGVYNEKLVVRNGGSAAGGFVTLRAHPGESVVLDGTGRTGPDMIRLNEKTHVRIQGLEIRNNAGVTDGSGIRLLGACRNVQILDNTIHGMRGQNAMGITVYGTNRAPASNLLIRANHLFDCDAAPSEALALNGNIVDFEVSSNLVHDINNIGIVFIGGETDVSPYGVCRRGVCRGNRVYRCRSSYGGGYAAGIYVDGGQDIVVEHNRIHECDLGLEVGCENAGFAATGVVVRANLAYDNDKAGLVFGGYDAARGRVNACQFLNNVCYRNDTLQDGNGELWIQYGSDNVVRNNIFSCGPQNLALADAGASANRNNALDYNLWFSSAGLAGSVEFNWRGSSYVGFPAYRTGSGQDVHSAFANPQFADGNVAAFDGHPLASSPAINAGDPAYSPPPDVRDADGNLRVAGGRVDVGAYEWLPVPMLSVTPANQAVGFAAGLTTFSVANAGVGTMSYAASEAESWLGISAIGATGGNGGTIRIAYTANPGTTARTGMVTVTAAGAISSPKVVKVIQAGKPAISISPSSRVHSAAGIAGQRIDVSAMVPWTATANQPWIAITGGATGTGNGMVTYRVSANAGAVRSGTITLTGGGISRTFTVNQWPASATPGVSAEGDVDGDGAADLSVFHPATGNWRVLFNAGARWVLPWGWAATVPVPADYNGDGMLDFAVYHPATGNWHIQESATGRPRQMQFGWSATVPLPGDYDGDGQADLAVYHAAAGRWYFLCSTAGRYSVQWGWSMAIPVPADYDGDGKTDIAVYHPPSGLWQILKSSTGGAIQKTWGWSTALPVPADYNGDGKADIAVFHRATGTWRISYSGGGSRTKQFGWATTIPVAADYDGDGEADLAVYHPATGNWHLLKSTTGGTLVKNWGWSAAKPTLLYPLIHAWFGLP